MTKKKSVEQVKTKVVPMKRFKFSFEVEMDEDQIWPNGDGPDHPDVDEVWDEIHGAKNWFHEWNLLPDLQIEEVDLPSKKKKRS